MGHDVQPFGARLYQVFDARAAGGNTKGAISLMVFHTGIDDEQALCDAKRYAKANNGVVYRYDATALGVFSGESETLIESYAAEGTT